MAAERSVNMGTTNSASTVVIMVCNENGDGNDENCEQD